MQLGPLEFRRRRQPAVEHPDVYPARLDELAGMLHGTPWLLAGGLAIPVTLGEFYRHHADVDIAFPAESFRSVTAALRRCGYRLRTRFPMSLFGACRFDVHVPLRPDGPLARWRPRKLKFHAAPGTRARSHLLASIEALPYRIVNDCYATCDGRYHLPLVRPLIGHRAVSAAGHEIPCLDLHYVARIKEVISAAKHTLDLEVIRTAPRRCAAPAAAAVCAAAG